MFYARYPDIMLKIIETGVYHQQKLLARGRIDLGFMTLIPEQQTEDVYIPLCREEILLAAPPSYPMDGKLIQDPGSDVPVADLAALGSEYFGLMSRSSTLREIQENILKGAGMNPAVLFETSRQNSILDMVSNGMCLGLISSMYRDQPHKRDISFYHLSGRPGWNYMASYRRDAYLSEPEKYLIRLFSQAVNPSGQEGKAP